MATYKVEKDGKAPKGLKEGDTVVTGGGTYKITGTNPDGTYKSTKESDITTKSYTGTYATPSPAVSVIKNSPTTNYTPLGTYRDAEMSAEDKNQITNYQTLYANAIANGDKDLANFYHNEAQKIRAGYGYSGGIDGSDYISLATGNTTPTFEFSEKEPTFNSKYDAQMEELLNQILNRENFSYDVTKDPLYAQYQQMYSREGDRAMRDTMAEAAAGAGGMNSYAMTAASQANNYYMSQLNDKIPELYQLSYDMWLKDIENQVRDLGLLQNMDATQYNRYRDTMADYKDDRNFAYNMYRDDIGDSQWQKSFDYDVFNTDRNFAANSDRYNKEWDFTQEQTDIENSRYDQERAENQMMTIIKSAEMPRDELIAQAGWDKAEVERLVAAEKAKNTPKVKYVYKGDGTIDGEGDDLGLQGDDVAVGDVTEGSSGGWLKGLNDLGLATWAYDSSIIVQLADAGAIYEENGKLKWADGWNALNFRNKLNNSLLPQTNYNFK